MLKNCRRCGEVKNVILFYPDSRNKDGLRWWCKSCDKEYAVERKGHNRQKLHERRTKRREEDVCKVCGGEKLPHGKSLCEKHYYNQAIRHAIKSPGKDAYLIAKQKMIDQNFTCPYTGVELVLGLNCEFDHIYPRSRYPELENDPDNLIWVLDIVNQVKRNKTPFEFLEMCQEISEHTRKNAHS